ncbi:unnamed protein product [Musa textilis]
MTKCLQFWKKLLVSSAVGAYELFDGMTESNLIHQSDLQACIWHLVLFG